MLGLGHFLFMPPEDDATPEEIEALNSMAFSLLEYLHEERDSLESDYIEAKLDKLSPEVIAEKLAALNQFKKLIDKAREYSCNFDDEIAKGELSAIRIHETGGPGEKHYTLNSLREWMGDCSHTDMTEQQNQNKEQKLRAQEKAILDEIIRLGYDPKNLPRNKAGKAGVKAEVRQSLTENGLFSGMTVFDKAWERLRRDRDIADVK